METPIKKKRGRPKKDKGFEGLKDIVDNGTTVITLAEDPIRGTYDTLKPKEVIVEKIVEKIIEVPAKVLEGFALYKKLKDNGYPQGGMGRFVEDPNGLTKVYIPRPEEIYTHFIADPNGWQALTDTLTRAWIELSIKK